MSSVIQSGDLEHIQDVLKQEVFMFVWMTTRLGHRWLKAFGLTVEQEEADRLPKCENWPDLLRGLFL